MYHFKCEEICKTVYFRVHNITITTRKQKTRQYDQIKQNKTTAKMHVFCVLCFVKIIAFSEKNAAFCEMSFIIFLGQFCYTAFCHAASPKIFCELLFSELLCFLFCFCVLNWITVTFDIKRLRKIYERKVKH